MIEIKTLPLVLSVGVCFLAAGIGSVFTTSAIDTWYSTLQKPVFSPPNWIFGPVWTLLYLMMGISLYIFWNAKTHTKERHQGLSLFFVQLALNVIWSILFFGLHLPFVALIDIMALWLTIFLTIIKFNASSKPAAYLLIPYLLWVSFATILNLAIVLLNT